MSTPLNLGKNITVSPTSISFRVPLSCPSVTPGTISDVNGSIGTLNQVLTSSGSGSILWKSSDEIITNNNILLPVSPLIYADSKITPILTYSATYGYDGWGFINAVLGQKYNWYFGPPSSTTPLSQLSGIYFTFYAIVPTVASFLTVYTVPVSGGWYNSKRDFVISTPILAGKSYIAYHQFDSTISPPTKYGHLPIALTISPVNPAGTFASTENIEFFAISSNSAQTASTEQLIVSSVGVIINDGTGNIYNQPFTFTSA